MQACGWRPPGLHRLWDLCLVQGCMPEVWDAIIRLLHVWLMIPAIAARRLTQPHFLRLDFCWVGAAHASLWLEDRQLAESRERAGWHEHMSRGKVDLPEQLQVASEGILSQRVPHIKAKVVP